MTNPTPHQCLALYSQGLTMKEVASILNTSISAVNRRLKKAPITTNYHSMLVRQCALDLRQGNKCYCFNMEQVEDIKRLYADFIYYPNGVGYTLEVEE